MKRFTMAAMMLCGTICSASADTVWQGDLFIIVSNATCAANNLPVGAFFRAVFKPANIDDNGTDTKLSLIGSRNAQRYLLAGKAFGNGTFSGTGIGTTADHFTWNSVFTAASAAPAPTINTQAVTLKATIATFDDIAGCTLTIHGSLGKRPN